MAYFNHEPSEFGLTPLTKALPDGGVLEGYRTDDDGTLNPLPAGVVRISKDFSTEVGMSKNIKEEDGDAKCMLKNTMMNLAKQKFGSHDGGLGNRVTPSEIIAAKRQANQSANSTQERMHVQSSICMTKMMPTTTLLRLEVLLGLHQRSALAFWCLGERGHKQHHHQQAWVQELCLRQPLLKRFQERVGLLVLLPWGVPLPTRCLRSQRRRVRATAKPLPEAGGARPKQAARPQLRMQAAGVLVEVV